MMEKTTFQAALVQLRSGYDVTVNVELASRLIREAAGAGAHYIQTPENTSLMDERPERLFQKIEGPDNNSTIVHFQALARELEVWLHIGSLAVKLSETKAANRSLVIAPDGKIKAIYDKIHMFDVDLANGESHRESKNFAAGDKAVLVDLPWGALGLSICYDLRFAHLYRALAQAGAQMLAVPAAFTRQTGQAHWHILLRARAVETGCYVLAAGQGGRHENGRETYGHSLILAPWGEILAEAGEEPGWIMAEIDLARVSDVRGRIPALKHDREFTLEKSFK